MRESRIEQIETYVKQVMATEVAHDFKHVDRVRRWALYIARQEDYPKLELLEATALLHDIDLPYVEDRHQHAGVGAELAARFLQEHNLFSAEEIHEIVYAIRHHSAMTENGELLDILREADTLDLLGAAGLMRAFTSKATQPEYDPDNIKGETWELRIGDFERRFAEGKGIGPYILDQINFQISCYENLRTKTARRIAKPLVEFMQTFLLQLETEICSGQTATHKEAPF
jgi:uncharacterized protein